MSAEQLRHGGNIVGSGLRVQGSISGHEDLLVDGIIDGPIHLGDGSLIVGANGKIISEVVAREVVIYGEAQGNLSAADRIEIKKEASVKGNLIAGRIVIEDGAKFKGAIEIVRPTNLSGSEPKALAATASPVSHTR